MPGIPTVQKNNIMIISFLNIKFIICEIPLNISNVAKSKNVFYISRGESEKGLSIYK